MTNGTPDPFEIRHFVDKVREIDKRAAINHYVRTGQSMQGAPDEVVVKVLAWLETLAVVYGEEPRR